MIQLVDVKKTYVRGKNEVQALRGVSFTVPDGQFVSIMGPSGSGKSTLLNVLGALDVPTTGSIQIEGKELGKLQDRDLSVFRRDRIGFVFQFFNLLPTLNAIENVMLPSLLAAKPRAEVEKKARMLLDRVGLGGRLDHRPDEMSGGEMQRVAVARALSTQPALLLADEPTGALDSKTGAEVLDLFRELHRQGNTLLLVTHDPSIAAQAERRVEIRDGLIAVAEGVA